MIVGIPQETLPGENRVALVPQVVPQLRKTGVEILLQTGAGLKAGFPDQDYIDKEVSIAASREEVFAKADVVLMVNGLGANPGMGEADLDLYRPGTVHIGFQDPLLAGEAVQKLADRKVDAFSMELIPRITRAQTMDSLSSMATIAGYKAVLLAADKLPRMFPMMMTAAGTLSPARVFVVGVGVAGLQAIATAKRLGAVVRAYDVRPAVKEQVESLGAKFVEMPLETGSSEDKGGYAKELGEEFYRRQRELMKEVLAESEVVITTAAIPGKKAPILVTKEMVEVMPPLSVLVDIAAERGGNCELTVAGEEVRTENGVTILGPVNLASTVPYHASQMYAKNIVTLFAHLAKEGTLAFNLEDEITRETLLTRNGEIVHPRLKPASQEVQA
jgi:NAD(P) transhydrogenase subunit alpha